MTVRILTADWRDGLASLDSECCQMMCSSPPYYGLRDYGVKGQLGLEKTPDEYVGTIVAGMRDVRRALAGDGTIWLNLGDSYCANWKGNSPKVGTKSKAGQSHADVADVADAPHRRSLPGLKAKDLIGIPWMVAFALRADGWYLRSDIIWAKPNGMPESVKDRPTRSHEYVFLLSKIAPRRSPRSRSCRACAATTAAWKRRCRS